MRNVMVGTMDLMTAVASRRDISTWTTIAFDSIGEGAAVALSECADGDPTAAPDTAIKAAAIANNRRVELVKLLSVMSSSRS